MTWRREKRPRAQRHARGLRALGREFLLRRGQEEKALVVRYDLPVRISVEFENDGGRVARIAHGRDEKLDGFERFPEGGSVHSRDLLAER